MRSRHTSAVRRARAWVIVLIGAVSMVTTPAIQSQTVSNPSSTEASRADTIATDSLQAFLQRAVEVNPQVRAARARVTAAHARIAPAGVRPDPMLMVGVQNVPLQTSVFADPMSMKMIGLSQTFPIAGKREIARHIAERETDATSATLVDVVRRVRADVRSAYYQLAFLDRALEIVQHHEAVLTTLGQLTETRYRVGTGTQADVLAARLDATRLAESAVALTAERRTTLATLNALLDRPSETPVDHPTFPPSLLRAVQPDSTRPVAFLAPTVGAFASNSPLPPLDSLQALAERNSAALAAQRAMRAAQEARVTLARKAAIPDITMSVQYEQRQALPDMLTATISLPLPIAKRQHQDALTASANAELLALDAEQRDMQNALRTEVSQLYTTAERARTQLVLYTTAILPQSRAAFTSATTSYQVSRTDLPAVLAAQAAVFNTETDYYRVLTDFATTIAALERTVGQELLP